METESDEMAAPLCAGVAAALHRHDLLPVPGGHSSTTKGDYRSTYDFTRGKKEIEIEKNVFYLQKKANKND